MQSTQYIVQQGFDGFVFFSTTDVNWTTKKLTDTIIHYISMHHSKLFYIKNIAIGSYVDGLTENIELVE